MTRILIACALMILVSCKKSGNTTLVPDNKVTVSIDGAPMEVDSIRAGAAWLNSRVAVHITIYAFLNHDPKTYCVCLLNFEPTDPKFVAGTVIDLATSDSASIVYANGNQGYFDYGDTPGAQGIITLTRNDPAARRIEGTISNCKATGNGGSTTVTVTGSFALNYK